MVRINNPLINERHKYTRPGLSGTFEVAFISTALKVASHKLPALSTELIEASGYPWLGFGARTSDTPKLAAPSLHLTLSGPTSTHINAATINNTYNLLFMRLLL
jgi:hypothetical protein